MNTPRSWPQQNLPKLSTKVGEFSIQIDLTLSRLTDFPKIDEAHIAESKALTARTFGH